MLKQIEIDKFRCPWYLYSNILGEGRKEGWRREKKEEERGFNQILPDKRIDRFHLTQGQKKDRR